MNIHEIIRWRSVIYSNHISKERFSKSHHIFKRWKSSLLEHQSHWEKKYFIVQIMWALPMVRNVVPCLLSERGKVKNGKQFMAWWAVVALVGNNRVLGFFVCFVFSVFRGLILKYNLRESCKATWWQQTPSFAPEDTEKGKKKKAKPKLRPYYTKPHKWKQ